MLLSRLLPLHPRALRLVRYGVSWVSDRVRSAREHERGLGGHGERDGHSSSGPHTRAGSNGSTVFSSCQPTAPVFNWGPEDQGGRKLRYSTCSICGESRLNLSLPRRHSVSVICKPPPSFMSALYLYSFPRLGIVLFLLRLHPHSNSRRLLGHSFQWQACLWFGCGPHVSPHPVDTSCRHHQHLAPGGT